MSEVEALLAQLRAAAESRGSGWLQATIQGLLPGSGEATASALPSSRPRRTRPPARLSPEVTPRVWRRLRSPSVAPPARAAVSTRSSRQSRAGRNPVVRRDPRRGVRDLPLSSDAGSVGSGAGSAGGSGPGLSARRVTGRQAASAGRRGPVCGPELVYSPEQRSAGFRSTLEDEGRATSGGRAADLQALGAPSGTRVTSGGEAEVLQALGSTSAVRETSSGAAAGLQAAGSTDSRDVTEQMQASGREFVASQVSIPHVPAGGVTASAQPGVPPCLVWIMGHSYVFWGALRAAVRPDGRQLSISREVAVIRWIGMRGMLWSRVLPEFYRFARLDRPPNVLVLHVGGNDLGARPFRELARDIKFDLLRLWAQYPRLVTVWSDMVPRQHWREARSVERLNKARIKVNRAVGRFVARNGGIVVRHRELEPGVGAFWRSDGVHLNGVGIDLWCSDLQDGIELALRVWRDTSR
ncbi:uncharacterized protein LOC122931380 [Bufo gargarizans]|uniref:uncharacterized protein LOC122931380 n=1 Tax=Bufo gargarizans TaxID=30331 RepID=UPI001CF12B0B|nr:uncharacterized protein LOC122931380 [Bufo gargarizans]